MMLINGEMIRVDYSMRGLRGDCLIKSHVISIFGVEFILTSDALCIGNEECHMLLTVLHCAPGI